MTTTIIAYIHYVLYVLVLLYVLNQLGGLIKKQWNKYITKTLEPIESNIYNLNRWAHMATIDMLLGEENKYSEDDDHAELHPNKRLKMVIEAEFERLMKEAIEKGREAH